MTRSAGISAWQPCVCGESFNGKRSVKQHLKQHIELGKAAEQAMKELYPDRIMEKKPE